MLGFGETKVTKEKIYAAKIKKINILDVISKLIETKTNSKYLLEYLDKVIRSLFFILPKMIGNAKTFKVKFQ